MVRGKMDSTKSRRQSTPHRVQESTQALEVQDQSTGPRVQELPSLAMEAQELPTLAREVQELPTLAMEVQELPTLAREVQDQCIEPRMQEQDIRSRSPQCT